MKSVSVASFALIILCSLAFNFRPQIDELVWETNFENAVAKAKKEKKKLFVNFTGSDWCGWCIRLDKEVFKEADFIQYANTNFVCVKIDFPKDKSKVTAEEKKQNQNLAVSYKIEGFPTILVLDAEKNVVMTTGYQFGGVTSYIEHLNKGINKK